ncbi:MAG: hypothetical protein U0269_06645 [Polyangiales bacterium]
MNLTQPMFIALIVTAIGCRPTPDNGDVGADSFDARAERDASNIDSGVLDAATIRDVSNTDIPNPDAIEAGASGPDCGFCGAHIPCPGGAHVDCMGGLACTPSGIPYAAVFAPYYTCTREEASQRLREGICAGPNPEWLRSPCAGGCAGIVEPRYVGCGAPINRTPGIEWLVRTLCATRPHVGIACRQEEDCHPAPDEPDVNLRCTAGSCARVPRPDPPAQFGETCGIDEAMLRPGIMAGATPCIVYGAPGCFVQRRTMTCVVDEHCPAGWDCALAYPCEGYCLPRGLGRDYHRLPTSCSASDAGPDANDASDGG